MNGDLKDAKDIFIAAVKLGPEHCAKYLDQACNGDARLRARVEELLGAHHEPGSFLDAPAAGIAVTQVLVPVVERTGAVIGPYKLLEQIGEGGFGTVYLAEQHQPVRRKVALKVIKPGMDSREVIARFEAERQALALMDHPNIAHVLDAGTTESGRPYFVMELVRGIAITEYCDQCSLTTRDRLDLFVSVCQAVQHAHQKGIIHRDIKPSNVMVAMQDGQPGVKVIDFGVAKAVSQRLTDSTVYTQFAQMIGTPMYMSPEQAEMSALDVDTRSDIYSLGVLLYELLTGTTPFPRQRLEEAGYDELRRIIREEEPPKPSHRLSTLGAMADTVAVHRHTDSRHLSQQLRGDLDWIVMKCLEKDRTRRYETASGLAMDLKRHLNDEPVLARSPSAKYRLQKFVRRNRAWLATAATVLLTVVIGLAVGIVLVGQERDAAQVAAERERRTAQEADRERQRAEANLLKAKEAVDRLFTEVAERLAGEPQMEQIRRRLLEDALEFYQEFLKQKSGDPVMRHEAARAYLRVGNILNLFGQPQRGEENQRQAITLLEKLVEEFPAEPEYREDLALCFGILHYTLSNAHQPHREEDFIEVSRSAVAEYEKLTALHPEVSKYRHQLAIAFTRLGIALTRTQSQEAEQHCRRAIAIWKQITIDFPNEPPDRDGITHAHEWLGILLTHSGRYQEAEIELLEALRWAPSAHLWSSVGDLYYRTGRPAEAEKYHRLAVEARQKTVEDFPVAVAEDHRRLAIEYGRLGWALFALGRTEEAEDTIRRGVSLAEKLTNDHPGVLPYPIILAARYDDLGQMLETAQRPAEAAEAFRKSMQLLENLVTEFPEEPQRNADLAYQLSSCPATQFRHPARAVEFAKKALQKIPTRAQFWRTLSLAEYRTGNWQATREAAVKARQLQPATDDWDLFILAMAQWQLGDTTEAQQTYERAVRWMDQNRWWQVDVRRFRSEAEGLIRNNESKKAAQHAKED